MKKEMHDDTFDDTFEPRLEYPSLRAPSLDPKEVCALMTKVDDKLNLNPKLTRTASTLGPKNVNAK